MTIQIDTTDSDIQRKLIKQVERRLPFLTAGEAYTLAAILGEHFWEDEEESHHSLGRAFSGMISQERLPFESNGWTKHRHNEYRYVPSE